MGYEGALTTGHPIEVPVPSGEPMMKPGLVNGEDMDGDSNSGMWSVKYIACGGRHTLALASWVSDDHHAP